MIKTLLKTLLMLIALGYLVFALVKVSRSTDELVCTGVEFQFEDTSEAQLIDAEIMANLLGQYKISPKGKTMAEIDMQDIESRLSAVAYIDTVHCYHTAAGKLCILVTPMHPILHVFSQNGEEFYVNKDGTIIAASGLTTQLPIVTGHVTPKYASTQLITLGKFLRDDDYWKKQVQQINIDEKGMVEIIPTFCQQRILLGEPKHIAEKLQRVRLFYEKAMPKTGWNKYNVINAMYDNQIICKKDKQ